MIEALKYFVGSLVSLASVSYLVALILSYLVLRDRVKPDRLRFFLLAPLVRVGSPSLIITVVLVAFRQDLVLILLVLPAAFTAILVSSCYLLAELAKEYGRSVLLLLPVFLPPVVLSSSLIYVVVESVAQHIPGAYMGLFLVYATVFSLYGCMSYQPSFLFGRGL